MDRSLPVAVIGAGPVGLAAAAHLLRRGFRPVVLEAGFEIASSVREWGHVRMFSPWRFNIDREAGSLLEQSGWRVPDPDLLPTGEELVERYLLPLAALPQLKPHIRLGRRVVAVGRKDLDKVKSAGRERQPFLLQLGTAQGPTEWLEAGAVLDCSGTWNSPNPLGAGGLPVLGEQEAADRIRYGIPDVRGSERARYAGRRVMVVGSGHSAINAVLDLIALAGEVADTHVVWALRRDNLAGVFGGGDADQLAARGELGTLARQAVDRGAVEILAPFRAQGLSRGAGGRIRVGGDLAGREHVVEVDEIVVATGLRPDLSFLREIRMELDPWLECARALGPLIDPNLHSCGTVRPHGARELSHPERDFYILGMKSYGRAPTFLLATGYEQVRSTVAALAGDQAASRRVELVLPETGVCSATPAALAVAGSCGAGSAASCGMPAASEPVRVATAAGACCGAADRPATVATNVTAKTEQGLPRSGCC